ncbi:kynurenine formamidase isoform X2 [Gallus gallus]|uniref:kynurenine formamidase isoform X2 n=1 Tax=Gallus gallus TaxID=9031 RepID=UPI001AE6CB6B|nr:kynurenine formamidase isoform X2 [Gallus gallus]
MGRWQDMDLEELEEQYSPSRWSRRMDSESVIQAHIDVTTAGTQKAQAAAHTLLHVPYGDGEGEKLDIYFPVDSSETFPVFVYIHGGYWQCLSKDASGFSAPALLSQGVAVVALGYDIAPKGRQGPTGVMTSFGGSVPTWLCTLPRPHGCDGAPGAAQPCLPGEAIPQDQGYLLVWTLGRGSPGSHGLVHGLDRIWCGSRYQRSCSGKWPRGTVPSCVSHKQCLWLHPVRCLWLWPSTTPRSSAGSHRSTARLCARLVGLSLCWILPAWITLTSLRSCQRKLTS